MSKEQDEIRLKDLLGIFSNENYKDLIGILKRDQERYHKEQVKKINIPNVSQQRELLLAFFDDLGELPMGLTHYDREKVVEKFIANNCD